MADGTRFKIQEESIKALQEGQIQLRSDVDSINKSISKQEKMLTEVLHHLSRLPMNEQFTDSGPDSGASGSSIHDRFGVLGRHKPAPVKLSRFTGENPERWVAQATRYFDFYGISAEDRLMISSFYFDDAAADWFDWLQRHHQLTDWPRFTKSLLSRFKSAELEEPEGLLAKLQQTGTVADYRQRFESISNRTILLPAAFLVRCFISGLRADIKQSVLIHKPTTLDAAMDLAQAHESLIQLERGMGRLSLGSGKPLLPTPKTPLLTTTPKSGTSSNSDGKLGFRRFTPTEVAQKKSQGLCFRCDEKYSFDHKCKAPPQLLFFDDDVETPVPPPPPDGPQLPDEALAEQLQVDEVQAQSAISYNALAGGCSSTTL
jgi:hypothetical protein